MARKASDDETTGELDLGDRAEAAPEKCEAGLDDAETGARATCALELGHDGDHEGAGGTSWPATG